MYLTPMNAMPRDKHLDSMDMEYPPSGKLSDVLMGLCTEVYELDLLLVHHGVVLWRIFSVLQ